MRFLRSLSSLLVFFLCSIVFVNTPCWAARWWEVTTSDNGSITYIDLDTIEVRDKDLLTAWVKTVNKNEKKLKSEDDYVKGYRVASSKDYNIYNCTSQNLKTLEWVDYGASGQVLRSISNPNGGFNTVVPDTIGKAQLEFVCGLQDELNMGLIGETLYKHLKEKQGKEEQKEKEEKAEKAIIELLDEVSTDINNGKFALSKNNKPLAKRYLTEAYDSLSLAFTIADNAFNANKQHYLLEQIYLRGLEIAKIGNDSNAIKNFTQLLETYRSGLIVEPTMPVASPDTKLEPNFIKPSQEQMQKIQQKHKRH